MGAPTIKDVARLAGVSIATVSRVLNKHENVQEEYVKRTMDAVRTLNYKPNIAAQSIRGQATKLIGVLVPEIVTPFFARVVSGAVTRAQELNQAILLKTSNRSKELDRKCLFQLSELPISGLIYGPLEIPNAYQAQNIIHIPTAIVARRHVMENMPHIYVDNFKSGYMATKYMARLGRKRICIIAGFWLPEMIQREDLLYCEYDSKLSGIYSGFDRYLGYRKALEEDGIPFHEELVYHCGFDYEAGYRIMKEIAQRMIDLDAIIAPNDMVAAGIMNFLKEQSIKVPEAISVIGHGDVLIPDVAEPELSSINQNPKEMGRQAVDTVNDLIQGKEAKDVVIDVALTIRRSTCSKV